MNYLNFDKMNEIVEDALCKVNISNECPICKTLLRLARGHTGRDLIIKFEKFVLFFIKMVNQKY